MAISLKEAFALNGTPDLTSFVELQQQCKNRSYFTYANPINKLSSWEGYYYITDDYNIELAIADTVVPASGGTVEIHYIIRQTTSNGDVALSGVTPTVVTEFGSVTSVSTTDSGGGGVAVITVGSLGTKYYPASDYEVKVLYNGKFNTISFKVAENYYPSTANVSINTNIPTSALSNGSFVADLDSSNNYFAISVYGTGNFASGSTANASGIRVSNVSIPSTASWITWSSSDPYMAYIADNSGSTSRTATVTITGGVTFGNGVWIETSKTITITQEAAVAQYFRATIPVNNTGSWLFTLKSPDSSMIVNQTNLFGSASGSKTVFDLPSHWIDAMANITTYSSWVVVAENGSVSYSTTLYDSMVTHLINGGSIELSLG